MVVVRLLCTLLLLAAAGCSVGGSDADTTALDSGGEADVANEPSAAPRDAVEDEDAAPEAPGGDAGEEGDGAGAGLAVSADDLPETAAGDRVIKQGTVTLAVEAGAFDRAFARVVDVAARLGGNVLSSTTITADGGGVSGSVTVRVPVERYEQLLVGVGDIGDVRARDVTAEDVTGEFVDLESRLRHLEAQERFYLELLADADGVSDAIAVQQQLTSIQSQAEQVRGRLQLLDSRTTFSTLTVELFEPSAPPSLAFAGSREPSLAHWWTVARGALVNVVGALLVATFFAGPLLLVAAAGWLAWRVARRPAAPAPQA